jgi:hypothetical protein
MGGQDTLEGMRALLVLLALAPPPAAAQNATPRQVAAPASDILSGVVRLPDPEDTATTSRAAILPLRFRREGEGWSAEAALPIEASGALSIAILSPDAGSWELATRPPGSSSVARTIEPAGLELPGWTVDRYDVQGARSGEWKLRIEAGGSRAPAEGWLLASADRDLRIEAHVTTLELVGGAVIDIAARAIAEEDPSVERARVLVEAASRVLELPMEDEEGDGLYEAIVPDWIRGNVRARVELRGRTAGGESFLRSAVIAFPVLERALILDGTARAGELDERRVGIAIGAIALAPAARFHVSAEVWGRDAAGALVPICWLSRMLEPESDGTLSLVLDARWLDVAGVGAPAELREVRVQDPDTEVVIDRVERMPLEVGSLPVRTARARGQVTTEMLLGHQDPAGTVVGLRESLMLVHGYCSGGSIWPAADFTQPKTVFLDPNQNRTHDQFAQLLAQHAQNADLKSFGVVAHSQGGCAALHLLTYYTSGLDLASGGRRIQSVATPYQGTPLADFGGLACGVNNNMTTGGAATWLSGIPSWARAEVSYWTTSNSGSACSPFTDFLLTNPEDGTVEQFRGQLPGANSMGHVLGWCHTTGMSNPANYTDHARNQAMNGAAAR